MNEMRDKHLFKEMLFILDTCEAMSMFEELNTPGIAMVASALNHESAIAATTDPVLNTYESDLFTQHFGEWIHSPAGFAARPETSVKEFERLFDFRKIQSHLTVKATTERPASEIKFREYLPINKISDVVLGEGINGANGGTKFYNWDDLL